MEPVRLFFGSSCPGNTFFVRNTDPLFREINSGMNMEQASKRRPFFSSPPEELLDEEYYDEQQPDQKKRRLTPEQVHLLEKSFEEENKLEPERKTQLAKKLGLQTRQVAVWFQNRRARWKNKQLEKDYDHLKSSFDFLKSDYDSVLKENEKLKAELMALVEKLRAEEVAVVEAISGGGVKTDHLSSGSVGSAIVDDGRHLMDSGDSYFISGDYHTGCAAAPAVDGIGSEEDDGSDDGRNYFSDEIPVLVAVEEEEEEVAEQNGGETWWVWS